MVSSMALLDQVTVVGWTRARHRVNLTKPVLPQDGRSGKQTGKTKVLRYLCFALSPPAAVVVGCAKRSSAARSEAHQGLMAV